MERKVATKMAGMRAAVSESEISLRTAWTTKPLNIGRMMLSPVDIELMSIVHPSCHFTSSKTAKSREGWGKNTG